MYLTLMNETIIQFEEVVLSLPMGGQVTSCNRNHWLYMIMYTASWFSFGMHGFETHTRSRRQNDWMIFKFMMNPFVWFLRHYTSAGRHRQKPLHVASFMGLNNDNGAAFLVQSKPKLKTGRITFFAWKFKLSLISGRGGPRYCNV